MTDSRQAVRHVEEALGHFGDGKLRPALASLDKAFSALGTEPLPWDQLPSAGDRIPWTRVVDALREGLDQSEDIRTRLALGHALARAGRPHEANDAYDLALHTPAATVDARIGIGRCLLALSQDADALAAFDQALDEAPETPDALAGRAEALQHLGKREAASAWRSLAAVVPDHPSVGLQPRSARALPRPPLPDDEEDARALCLALSLYRDGRHDEASETLLARMGTRKVSPLLWVALARIRHAQGDIAGSRAAVTKARDGSLPPRAMLALAGVLRALGDESARAMYAEAASGAPDDPFVLAGHAEALRALDSAADALVAAEAALALHPRYAASLVARARALVAVGREDEAQSAWQAVLEAHPGHAEATRALQGRTKDTPGRTERGVARIHYDLGRTMLQRGRHREAIHAFQSATEIRPDWHEPWRLLGQAFLLIDDRSGALEAFRTALEREPTDTEAATRLGDLQRDQGALQAALVAYDQALLHDEDHARARFGRAETRRLLGQFEPAVQDFEASLRAHPEDAGCLMGLAAALNGLRRFTEARPVWIRARERDPNSTFVAKGLAQCQAGLRGTAPLAFEDISREPQPRRTETWTEQDEAYDRYEAMDHVDRGRSYHKERNYAAAIDAFRRALEIDPTCDEAALRLGMAYEDDRQFRKAISAYRTCLEIEPNHYQAATNIGEAYRKNEQYREAIAAYDQALAMKADYLYALAGRAECMRMLGRYEECLGWFDKALAVGPNHAFGIQGKAAALNALQRFEDAIAYWNHAIEIEPQSQFALDGKAYCEAQIRRIEAERLDEPEADDPDSATPTLDEQGRDLTALARAGKLPKVIGRDKEVRQVMKTLVRRLKANPLLLGEPGVGKTAVVEGLAQRLASGDAPERLKGLRIIELSMGSLIAGTKYRGTFEERLREIVKEATSAPGLVLFIDEIHTLVGAGRTEGGSLDAANILKPALARGEITVIGATTHAEFRRHFETDSALERRFQPITVDEPSEEACIELLEAVKSVYEKHHGVKVRSEAVTACVQMAVRFLPDRRLPDKALDMLDEACSEASLAGLKRVDRETVARVVSERTGVPVQKLTEEDLQRMEHMEAFLAERVVGQDPGIRRLADAVRLAKSGLRTQDRPRAVFLFRGASGVGKTELAKALSDFLFPEGDALIRLDMSEYADRFSTTRLLGAPPGYAGHGEEGQLTGPLRRRPYSVVLLDEFEKADAEVQGLFLSLLDEGIVTDADGRQVNAREAFFILTTNAGTEQRGRGRVGFGAEGEDDREAVLATLKSFFRPELLDRIDDVITFQDLDAPALREVARMRVRALVDRAEEHGLTLRWDDALLDHIVTGRKSGERGARQINRAVDALVAEPLGRMLLTLGDEARRTLRIRVSEGELHFDEVQQEAQPPRPVA